MLSAAGTTGQCSRQLQRTCRQLPSAPKATAVDDESARLPHLQLNPADIQPVQCLKEWAVSCAALGAGQQTVSAGMTCTTLSNGPCSARVTTAMDPKEWRLSAYSTCACFLLCRPDDNTSLVSPQLSTLVWPDSLVTQLMCPGADAQGWHP